MLINMRLFFFLISCIISIFILIPLFYLIFHVIVDPNSLKHLLSINIFTILFNSIMLSLIVTVLSIFISLPAAFLTTRTNLHMKKFWTVVFVLPLAIPSYIGSFTIISIFVSKDTLLYNFLELFGIQPLALLSDENFANYGIIAAAMWPQIAYCLILYITGLAALNKEIIESAKIDGASGWGMFWNIILPQLRPATFIAVVVSVLGALRSFDLVAIMTQGGPWGSTTVLAYEMVEQAIFNYRMGYGAALATILFLILDVYIVWFLIRVWKNEKGRL